jgi:hypothetical protein
MATSDPFNQVNKDYQRIEEASIRLPPPSLLGSFPLSFFPFPFPSLRLAQDVLKPRLEIDIQPPAQFPFSSLLSSLPWVS